MRQFQREYWEREKLDQRRAPTHPVIRAYVESKLEAVRPYIELDSETRLLDVGCGNGFFTFHWDRLCDVTGVDYSEKMLELSPVKKTFLMDAADLQFEDNSFDVVFCHALLHHVADVDRVLSEMRRVSRRYVIVIEPNRNNPLMFLFTLIVPEERRALRFSLAYVKALMERNGLRVTEAFSHGLIVPNKTPTALLPLITRINGRQPLGMTHCVISEKMATPCAPRGTGSRIGG